MYLDQNRVEPIGSGNESNGFEEFDEDGYDSEDDDDPFNKFKAQDDSFERIDSRGKKMKLRRTKLSYDIRFPDPVMRYFSFATINFDSEKLLTQKELKLRANSLAYS